MTDYRAIYSNLKMKILSIVTILIVLIISKVTCLCSKNGQYFKSPLEIQQINLTTVRVSWFGIVEHQECADYFYVKYWPG